MDTEISRRKILGVAGAATAAQLFGVRTANAEVKELGSVLFAEANISNEIAAQNYSQMNIDQPSEHTVEEGKLFLSPTARDQTQRLFNNNDAVAWAGNYQRLPGAVLDSERSWIPTKLNQNLRVIEAVLSSDNRQLANPSF